MNTLYKILIGLVLFLLLSVTAGGISQNDRWRVSEIKISGANVVPNDEIRARVGEKLLGNYYFVYSKGNSYLFPRREIEASLLQNFTRLATATVRRASNRTIIAEVTERKPFAIWCGEVYLREVNELNNCWFIDYTGFVFDRAPIFSEGVYPEVYGKLENIKNSNLSGARLLPDRFNFVQTIEQKIREKLGEPLRTIIKSEDEYGVTIHTSIIYPQLVGAELRFKDGTDADTLIKTLLSALPAQFPLNVASIRKLQYIDLRFGNKVFFGFEN